MPTYREEASSRAHATNGRFIGVIFDGPIGMVPTWKVFPFHNHDALAEWYGEVAATPGLYQYLAMFDKATPEWDEGQPVSDAIGQPPEPAHQPNVGAAVAPHERLHHLDDLVARHEVFWGRVGQQHPTPEMREFLRKHWDPWFALWTENRPLLDTEAGRMALIVRIERRQHAVEDAPGEGHLEPVPAPRDLIAEFVAEAGQGLTGLRELAAYNGIPTPDLGTSKHGFIREERAREYVSGAGARGGARSRRSDGGDRHRALQRPPVRVEDSIDCLVDDQPEGAGSSPEGAIMSESVGHGGHGHGHHGGRRRRFQSGGFDSWYPYWYGGGDDDGDVFIENADVVQVGKNSFDPWRDMESSPPAEYMRVPSARGGHQVAIGANPVPRPQLVTELAPVLAPGTGGVRVALHLDPQHRLHASICVDGKCYRTSADLSELIATVMQKVAAEHARLHAEDGSAAQPKVSGEVLLFGEVNGTIEKVGEVMVNSLVDQHVHVACAGWLDDVGNAVSSAVSSAVHGVSSAATSAFGTVGHTLWQLKGPIAKAASVAAGAAAASVPGVGPALAPIAANLANSIVNAAAGSGSAQQVAKQVVQQATAAAASDPRLAKALDAAHKAVARTTATYHLAQTTNRAKAGDQNAKQALVDVASSAATGDPAAKQALAVVHQLTGLPADLAAATVDALSDGGGGDVADAGDSGDGDATAVSGLVAWLGGVADDTSYDEMRARAREIARALYRRHGARYIGVEVFEGDHEVAKLFKTPDEAKAWIDARSTLPGVLYVAIFDAQGRDWPGPLADSAAPAPDAQVGIDNPRVTILGASLHELRTAASAAALTMPGRVVGVVRGADGMWQLPTFGSSDDADDWFGHATSEPSSYAYAAYFDKLDPTFPMPLNESLGHARAMGKVA